MKTHSILFLAALSLLASQVSSAVAAVTPWVISEGGKVRLAALSEGDDGKITAIIEIEPAPGWKTYWRNPGGAGMAPQIDLSAGRNLKLLKLSYPPPEIGSDEGGAFLGYRKPVSLVLELQKQAPAEPAELNADVLIGLCKDICLPFQAKLSLPLADPRQPEADEFMKIQMAKAELPGRPSSDFKVIDARLTPDRLFFEATVRTPDGKIPEIAVAPSGGLLLDCQPEVKDQAGTTVVRYRVEKLPASKDAANVTVLMKSAGRAIEATLAVN